MNPFKFKFINSAFGLPLFGEKRKPPSEPSTAKKFITRHKSSKFAAPGIKNRATLASLPVQTAATMDSALNRKYVLVTPDGWVSFATKPAPLDDLEPIVLNHVLAVPIRCAI